MRLTGASERLEENQIHKTGVFPTPRSPANKKHNGPIHDRIDFAQSRDAIVAA